MRLGVYWRCNKIIQLIYEDKALYMGDSSEVETDPNLWVGMVSLEPAYWSNIQISPALQHAMSVGLTSESKQLLAATSQLWNYVQWRVLLNLQMAILLEGGSTWYFLSEEGVYLDYRIR